MRLALIVLILCNIQAFSQALPRILNVGDTAIASAPVWVQSVKSEVDQRIEAKQLKEKLTAYVKKTAEIESLQTLINQKEAEKEKLVKENQQQCDLAISALSKQISECNNEAEKLRSDTKKLQNQINRLSRTNRGWRRTAIFEGIIIAGALLFLIL